MLTITRQLQKLYFFTLLLAWSFNALCAGLGVSSNSDNLSTSTSSGARVFLSLGTRAWEAPKHRINKVWPTVIVHIRTVGKDDYINFYLRSEPSIFGNSVFVKDEFSIGSQIAVLRPGNYEIYGFSMIAKFNSQRWSTYLALKKPMAFFADMGKTHYLGRFLFSPVIMQVYPPAYENDEQDKLLYSRYSLGSMDLVAQSCSSSDLQFVDSREIDTVLQDKSVTNPFQMIHVDCGDLQAAFPGPVKVVPESKWNISEIRSDVKAVLEH